MKKKKVVEKSPKCQTNRILVSGIDLQWQPGKGICAFERLPVAMMWIDTTLAGLMSGVQEMVGTKRFALALQSEGRKSVEADWQVISQFPCFEEGFKAIANIAAVAGWGRWELVSVDEEHQQCRFRVTDGWEGKYQKALGVSWGSGMLAGKLAGYCSRLFQTNCWADQVSFHAKGAACDEFVVTPSPRSVEAEIESLLLSDEATRADMAVALRKLEKEIAERTRVEAALGQSIDFQKALMDAMPVPVFHKNTAGLYTGMNQAFVEFYGKSEEELIEKTVYDVGPKELAEVYRAADAELFRNPGQLHYESQVLDTRNVLHDVIFHKSTFTGPDGQLAGIIGAVEDITARKKAEQALRESEERYRNFVANATEGIFRIDFTQSIQIDQPHEILEQQIAEHAVVGEVNTALAAMYGVLPEDMVGHLVREFAPNCGTQMADLLQIPGYRIVDRGEAEVMADGMPLHIVESYTGVVENGILLRVWGVQRNVTKQKIAESALRESEERYRILVEHNQDGVFILQEGRFTYVNQAFAELADLPVETIVGMPMPELVAPEDREAVLKRYLSRSTGERVIEEYEFRALRGREQARILVHMKVGAISLQGKMAVIGTLRDITKQRTAEAALKTKHEELQSAYAQLSAAQIELRRSYDELAKSQEALRVKEERIRTLTENSADLIFRMDLATGNYEYINPAALSITGYSSEMFYREPWLIRKLIHPDWRAYFEEQTNKLMRGEVAPTYEYQFIHASGEPRWLFQRNVLIKDKDGKPLALEGIVSDITERKSVEQQLLREMNFTDTLINSLPGIFFVFDSQGFLIRWNKNHENLLEYLPEELPKTNIFQLVDEDSREAVINGMKRVFTDGSATLEATVLSRKGKRTPFHMFGVRMVVGDETYIVGTGLDITERKRAEDDLRRSQQMFSTIFSANPAAIILSTLSDAKCVDANDAYARLLGYTREELLARTTLELNIWHAAGDHQRVVDELTRKGRLENAELTLRKKNGELISTVAGGELLTMNGQRYMLSFFFDITERKRDEAERIELQRRLLHAQKLESLGVLAGGIAHDFNNLLMAILGNLDMTLMDLPPSFPVRGHIEQAMAATRRATDLTRQMLAYSGRGRLLVARIDLNELMRENAELFRTAIARTVTMILNLAGEPPFIEADAGQLQQIIMNLITNASEAIGDRPGSIILTTGSQMCDGAFLGRSRLEQKSAPGRFAFLEVRDTGAGMDEATQQRLFDPFFTTKFTGRGLGMSAVLGIVSGHKGAIMVESEVGRGTAIRVFFPVCEPPERHEIAATPAPTKPDGRKTSTHAVLVVDDDETVRSLCTRYIQQLGHRVFCAVDGEDAVDMFRRHGQEIDCVLLDLTMPRMDGVRAFRQLKNLQADVKVILCSGYSEQDAVERFSGEGLAGFIQKPYRLQNLKSLIEHVLGMRD